MVGAGYSAALLAKSRCRYGHLERLGAHARPQSAMVPPSKTPKFMPSQKPIAMAAAIVIVSPLCAGPAIGGSAHDRADVPPDVRIESEHLDTI
jgi:hypothetical protein